MRLQQKVEYVFLSRNCGLKVSNICLGALTFGPNKWLSGQNSEDEAHAILDKFEELGGNFIDTSNVYSGGKSEEIIGSWMKKRQNRNKMVIATKCRYGTEVTYNPNRVGLSRKHIVQAVEGSQECLQTDYIDLYQIHSWDNGTPIKEVLTTMDDLVRAGKVCYVGASNLTGWQLQKIVDLNQSMGLNPWVSLQQEYNLLQRYGELDPFEVCRNEGLGVLPWSPLKSGLLTGKYKKGQSPPVGTQCNHFREKNIFWERDVLGNLESEKTWQLLEAVEAICQEVALRWLLQKPFVTSVITGARTLAQLEENIGAGGGWELSRDQMERLDEVAWYEIGDAFTPHHQKGRERVMRADY